MRRLIESGALRGDRFLQIGLRGYWPPPETLDWMAEQRMRSYEMTEIGERGLDDVPDRGVRHRHRRLRRRVPLGRHRRVRPGARPRHRHARAGRAHRPRSCSTPYAGSACELPVVGRGRGRGRAALRPRRHHRGLANRVVLEALSAIARRRRDAASGATWDRTRPLLDGR